MLVHICCAVDSHYFLQRLREDFPDERLVGYFYDPNIHPYSEYRLRLLEVQRSCKRLKIELIEGEYNVEGWLDAVRGLEFEPEKGKRCGVCFDYRFRESAKMSLRLNIKKFTSTLLISPKKSINQLKIEGEKIAEEYGLEFVTVDYRVLQGTQAQNRVVKLEQIYRQDYCGCIYGLKIQREEQKRLSDELFSPLSKRVEPNSIEYRIQLYEKRWSLEDAGGSYKIVRERFLNYRLKYAYLKIKKKSIPSHILPYSTLKRGFTRGNIEYEIDGIYYLSRDEVKFITLEYYNRVSKRDYGSIEELILSPPTFEDELKIRREISPNPYDISTIVVIDKIRHKRIELFIDSNLYEDTISRLIEIP